jgi:uncharacterized Zn-finger protein
MGILDRIFKRSAAVNTEELGYVECVDIVQAGKTRAAIDPDYMPNNDPQLERAKKSIVVCPYCNTRMKFEQTLVGSGMNLKVRCPNCETEPVLHHEY